MSLVNQIPMQDNSLIYITLTVIAPNIVLLKRNSLSYKIHTWLFDKKTLLQHTTRNMTDFTDWLEIHVDDSGPWLHAAQEHRSSPLRQYTISTGTQHQYPLSVQQSSHDEHLQQVYYAIMRYSESVDKSGRWFEMMAMISVMLGYRAGAHHILWGVDSGLRRVSTHRLCLYIIGWGWS